MSSPSQAGAPGRPHPSVNDVATLAGVSLGTVSNVLNHPDRVAPATRARVERAMTMLAYVPNTITTDNNPLALLYGALVTFAAGGAPATGMIAIPNARVINTSALGASGAGALVSGYSIGQLTQ